MTIGFATKAVHSGQDPDPSTGAVIPPISLSTTFEQAAAGVHKGYEYSRAGNPTRKALETALAALENGTHAFCFSSGSAVTSTIVSLLSTGSHIVSVNDVYGGTFRYFTKVASLHGFEVDFVNLNDPANLSKAMKPNTKLVWIETPTNPTLRLVDIKKVAQIVHQHKDVVLVVDNTFMSPYNQNPLDLGADIVVHSITKYLNGHSDVVMGCAVMKNPELAAKFKFFQNAVGSVPSPFDCFLANRGLKTLHLRMKQHETNAMAVATYLEKSPLVDVVYYPGLASHPQHALAKSQQRGFGGMVSFKLKNGNLESSNLFLESLKLFALAESLGGVESLAELPSVMTHASVSPELRKELGITDSLIRLSVGIEETKDLVDDIAQALAKTQSQQNFKKQKS